MTVLIVARGESPGGGADPWTEGANLLVDGDFENPAFDPTFNGNDWNPVNNNEMTERLTVNPISGVASLHCVTTGEATTIEGCEGFMPNNSVSSRQWVRARYTIRSEAGNTSTVAVRAKFTTATGVRTSIIWEQVPPLIAETITIDLIVPDIGNYAKAANIVTWRPLLSFLSYGEVADFTIDDVYFGVLTPV